jgi:hypothetical protein
MRWFLPSILFAFAGLAAAQWRSACHYLYEPPPPGSWYCGNAVSDPYGLLVKYAVPVSAICAAAIARRCLRERRWGCREVAGLVAFAATSACLLAEGRLLVRYGFEFGRIWWLPGL